MKNNNKNLFFTVFNYFFKQKIQSWRFWFLTFALPFFGILCFVGAIFFGTAEKKQYKVLIYCENPQTLAFVEALGFKNSKKYGVQFAYSSDYIFPQDLEKSPYNVEIYLDPEVLLNLQTTPKTAAQLPVFYTEKLSLEVEKYLKNELELSLERLKIQLLNQNQSATVDLKTFDQYKVRVFLDTRPAQAGIFEGNVRAGWVAWCFTLVLMGFLFLFLRDLAGALLLEKSNKMMEMIAVSLPSKPWIAGKMFFVFVCNCIQLGVFLGVLVLGFYVLESILPAEFLKSFEETKEILFIFKNEVNYFLIFSTFFLSFSLLSLLYGAMTVFLTAFFQRESQLHLWLYFFLLPLLFAVVFAYFFLADPYQKGSDFFYFFPLTAPILLFIRICYGLPLAFLLPTVLSMALQWGFAFFLLSKSAKFFFRRLEG